MSNSLVVQQVSQLAAKFAIPDSNDLTAVLKATAFKGQVSDAQMSALLIVATQYGLNPWTKEIYAFPDKNNGIVPVVGVDGWARIINSHPQFDGMDFNDDGESVECVIYRKDRSHPIKAREYMAECKRETQPWKSHPRRMLRHKAMIQCARLAFGYVGIYEQDEAERIIERDVNARPVRQSGADVASRAAETVEFMDAETREQLLADLEAAADTGAEALERAWTGITKPQRKALAGELDGLKARAARADKPATTEDEYVPE
jgi:phage recombination protein Bet